MAGVLVLLVAVEAAVLLKSTLPVTVYVVASLALTAWQGRSSGSLRWYRSIRPGVVLQSVAVLALQNPVLNWGWWAVVATQAGQDGAGGNILTAPLSYPILAIPFLALLALVLPRLAEMEEQTFRRGTRSWKDGIWRSLAFGLVHMLVGVPLAVALALSIGGLWFTRQYFLGGVARSTVYHLCYNCVAFALLAVALVLSLGG